MEQLACKILLETLHGVKHSAVDDKMQVTFRVRVGCVLDVNRVDSAG